MKVRYSPRAVADLANISDYLKTKTYSRTAAVEAAPKSSAVTVEVTARDRVK